MKEEVQLSVRCYCNTTAINQQTNNDQYRIVQLVSGSGIATIDDQLYFVQSGNILFLNPEQKIQWTLTSNSILHCCQVHPGYFSDRMHIIKTFRNHFYVNKNRTLSQPNGGQAKAMGMIFKMIRQEANGLQEDKKEAILIHLQMMLLLANRIHTIGTYNHYSN